MVHTQEVANMEQKIAQIKVSFGEEIRRMAFAGKSFNNLATELKKLFGLKEDCHLIVKYTDDDQDLITMSSDEELQNAISFASKGILRLQISKKFGKKLLKPYETESTSNSKEEVKEVTAIPTEFPKKEAWQQRKEKVKLFKEKLRAMNQVRLVKDVTFSDNSSLAPSTEFVKTWRIRNESETNWPEGCSLVFHKGDIMGGPSTIPVPQVSSGQEFDLSIKLTAPAVCGKYVGVWRLVTPPFINWSGENIQKKFGVPLRVKIFVSESEKSSSDISTSSSESEDEKKKEKKAKKELKKKAKIEEMIPLLVQLESMGFTDKNLNLKMLRKTHGDLDKVVVKLLKKKNKAAHKK